MTNLIDVKDAARVLGLSFWTLYAWARTGRLPSVQLGKRRLFDPRDLEEFIEHQRVPGYDASQRPTRLPTPGRMGGPPQG